MKKSKNLGTGWVALYQNLAGWLAQQRLTGEQYKVIFVLFNKLYSVITSAAIEIFSGLLNFSSTRRSLEQNFTP